MPIKKVKKNRGFKKNEIINMVHDLFNSNPKKTFNYKQIAGMIGLKKLSDRQMVQVILYDLLEAGTLTEAIKGRFKLVQLQASVTGVVDMTASGAAYIIPDDGSEDIFVAQANLNQALDGDKVKVSLFAISRRHQPQGEVTEIIKRKRELFVGKLEVSRNFAFLVTDRKILYQDIFIPLEKLNGGKDGQKAIAKITDWPSNTKNPYGEIVDVLGDTGNNDTEMHAILAEFNLPYIYPENIIQKAEEIDASISQSEISKRQDFREITTFTIDPADAKDFDDALSIKKIDEDTWEVGVHIADVTHYVKPNSPLDEEAFNRATSVYLVDRVVPMLPERLSNNICSLRANEDKLCFSATFLLDANAIIKDSWIGRTIINSNKRFSYEEAQSIIETGKGDYADELLQLNAFAKKLRDKRFSQGAISFERVEIKFNIDENGKPLSVFFKESKESNHLVEEFMLLANKRVAEIIGKKEIQSSKQAKAKTFVYRIHDVPNADKFDTFSRFIKKFGHEISQTANINKSLNQLLNEVQGKPEQNIIETLAIRTMAKAVYSTHNIGHYGLGFEYYTHFTSPIRRYPDMMVHRLLDIYMNNGKSADANKYEDMCEHCSDMEQQAAEAERASIKYKQVEFMKDHLGEEFEGVISGVTEWGIYVEINENKCEGLIPIRDLDDDFYYFDEENYCIIGKREKKKFQLGDPIKILIANANLEKKQLDFTLVKT
ncbi:MAG: ribonuclease R [Marinilabiliaceae bacterium]|nr:ribonuclease R [Marinilabiliaceae bacterium]